VPIAFRNAAHNLFEVPVANPGINSPTEMIAFSASGYVITGN